MLKQKDLKRATLIKAFIKGQCTVKQVALALGLSECRVKQIKREVKENGVKFIQHGNRGRKPKNTISDETKIKLVTYKSYHTKTPSTTRLRESTLGGRANVGVLRSWNTEDEV